MRKPPFGRVQGFTRAMELLDKKVDPVIVEVGTTRHKGNWLADGYSTPLFGWYVTRFGGSFTSVDIDSEAASLCREIFEEFDIPLERTDLVTADGIGYLKHFDRPIDLLYLDGWDYSLFDTEEAIDERLASEQAHLECFLAAEPHLNKGAVVLVDDCMETRTWFGKGKRLIPYLMARKYYQDPVSLVPQENYYPPEVFQYLCIKP
ncbi:class I SAM-dependent methyltransferase [Pseudodesulfovibrio sp. zrk46]|uniref:class I SAM-dependent methyltransferase n=1 Tax=Pseudodesulfovibrio sp. zrk46 TaxID=2725288 RepID=UPI001448AC49|nr:class I SAM-dependent methyltransferase [Pseudodesulfovibrio sp. zrk46]QJB56266.1 class I SAM-dependent methyltransferase [Pseudodesulfovibrio sp. zrk46]